MLFLLRKLKYENSCVLHHLLFDDMKRLLLLCFWLLAFLAVEAQDNVTLSFTAVSQSGGYCPFDYVKVTNVSRGWTDTLFYPDTTLVLACTDGLSDFESQSVGLEVFPNPFFQSANACFWMDVTGLVRIQLRLLDGSLVADYQGVVEEGKHMVSIALERPQMALLVVETASERHVAKVLQTGYGNGNRLSISSLEVKKAQVDGRYVPRGEFLPGDRMAFESFLLDNGNLVSSELLEQIQYSDDTITLDFPVDKPSVTTIDVLDITQNTARVHGEVVDSAGLAVVERGICWSLTTNSFAWQFPIAAGMGLGEYFADIEDLVPGATIYVKAYATNRVGTAYGKTISFVTQESPWPNGILPGLFSVSDTLQVQFSQGNLQYNASSDTWRFATSQLSVVRDGNESVSPTFSGWIDLFGWATSGYEHNSGAYQPWSTSTIGSDYFAYNLANYDLPDSTGVADWGYNAISNGGNEENQWRTLRGRDYGEWNYLLNERSSSMLNGTPDARYVKAVVSGMPGVILFPDAYVHPDSITLPEHINEPEADFVTNSYSGSAWTAMEEAGCVFLPTGGSRVDTGFGGLGSGCYWSADHFSDSYARHLYFQAGTLDANHASFRFMGFSVRLVRDVY